MKEKIRPIYSELQGYLAQAPKLENPLDRSSDKTLWTQVNNTINELNGVSAKNYDSFKLDPEFMDQRGMIPHHYIKISAYRMKLGGLIARLHAEYFSDEPAPFSGMPTTIISQTQQQNQSFQIQMLLEIQSRIDEKIPKFDEDSKEKKFLEKIKESLASVGNVSQLIALLLRVGKDIGLTVDQIFNIFK
ncbi:MAG: hypothetical protein UW73_C0028G0009 [Microgenomates group bacterium GW2011_GWB1_44_8]|nr:MAG: hypothetical protein UW73_C0028G0009 [Microgenomates group bacterium GW2011_GWB1_44_8]